MGRHGKGRTKGKEVKKKRNREEQCGSSEVGCIHMSSSRALFMISGNVTGRFKGEANGEGKESQRKRGEDDEGSA